MDTTNCIVFNPTDKLWYVVVEGEFKFGYRDLNDAAAALTIMMQSLCGVCGAMVFKQDIAVNITDRYGPYDCCNDCWSTGKRRKYVPDHHLSFL